MEMALKQDDILVSCHGDSWVLDLVTPKARKLAISLGKEWKWKNGAMVLDAENAEKVVRQAIEKGLRVSL